MALLSPLEYNCLFRKVMEGFCNGSKILDETAIVVG